MKNSNRGFIQIFIILVLIVVIISLLGVSIGELVGNKTLKDNFSYLFKGIKYVWDNYLVVPVKIIITSLKKLSKAIFCDVPTLQNIARFCDK